MHLLFLLQTAKVYSLNNKNCIYSMCNFENDFKENGAKERQKTI